MIGVASELVVGTLARDRLFDFFVAALIEQVAHSSRIVVSHDLSPVQKDDAAAQSLDLPQVMADQNHRFALSLDQFFHSVKAFALKCNVTHGEDLIDDEEVGIHGRRDGEAKAYLHARAVALHRGVDELFDLSKFNDAIELLAGACLGNSEDGAVQKNVFPTSEFWVDPCAHFDQWGNTAMHRHRPAGGLSDVGQVFQESALARAVRPDDADHLSRGDVQVDVLQSIKPLALLHRTTAEFSKGSGRGSTNSGNLSEPVLFVEVVHLDNR